ncbi:MAG: phosphatase PAP2 family protein [Gemmatimonadota bacterium]|nr:phosphatase PAP2 family protein [Gemmatimonadota bacterium]
MNRSPRRGPLRFVECLALALVLVPCTGGAQGSPGDGRPRDRPRPTSTETDSILPVRGLGPLFVRSDALFAAGVIMGTAAMMPLDRHIAQELQEPNTQASRATREAARAFNQLGGTGAIVIGVAMYAVGRAGHFHRVAELGLHGTEAILLSGALAAGIKQATGRARPTGDGTDPDDFSFGHGAFSSFPSGHATAAFAAATVVTLETRRWWPGSTWYIAPLMYGGATLVGASRLYSNKHWASDVVMGAGLGTLTGLKVVRFNHARPGNRIDRSLLGTASRVTVLPDGSGRVAIGWSIPVPGRSR